MKRDDGHTELPGLDNLHAIADSLGLNLAFKSTSRALSGRGYRTLTLAEGLKLPADIEVRASVVTVQSVAVLVRLKADLGLLVISRSKGMVMAVCDLSKLPLGGEALFWTEPAWTHKPAWSARLAQEAVEPATVAVFERTPPSAPWTRIS